MDIDCTIRVFYLIRRYVIVNADTEIKAKIAASLLDLIVNSVISCLIAAHIIIYNMHFCTHQNCVNIRRSIPYSTLSQLCMHFLTKLLDQSYNIIATRLYYIICTIKHPMASKGCWCAWPFSSLRFTPIKGGFRKGAFRFSFTY